MSNDSLWEGHLFSQPAYSQHAIAAFDQRTTEKRGTGSLPPLRRRAKGPAPAQFGPAEKGDDMRCWFRPLLIIAGGMALAVPADQEASVKSVEEASGESAEEDKPLIGSKFCQQKALDLIECLKQRSPASIQRRMLTKAALKECFKES